MQSKWDTKSDTIIHATHKATNISFINISILNKAIIPCKGILIGHK